MSEENQTPDPNDYVSVGGINTFHVPVTFTAGASPAPAFTFTNDSDAGFYRSGDKWMVTPGYRYTTQNVYSLYHKGKTMKDHADEYMDVIKWLTWVNGDHLKAIETFEYFRQQLFPESDEA